MKHIKLFEDFIADSDLVIESYEDESIGESLDFTLADIDADEEEISQTFAELAKFNKHVGAKKASDLYLAGGTQDGNDDGFIPKGRAEKLDLDMYPAMGGALVQIGTFQGEPAFQIDDRQDRFIFVGPKSKNKITEQFVNEGSKINYVTITNDLFHADANWWVKNKLNVSRDISKALAGCKTKHVILDIDKTQEL